MQMEQQILQVPIESIIPNRFQPRLNFDERGLEELANSIAQHGIIQPLVLRRVEDKYEIIAGERRYKAASMAGLKTVPAIISSIDDNKSAEIAIVENVQRRDLTPIEEARSYKNLLDKGYMTQSELAKKMGVSQSAVANKLRLLNLCEEVQQALLENKISERHARSLLTLSTEEEQKEWLNRILEERLTVRELDEAIKNTKNQNNDTPPSNTQTKENMENQNNELSNNSPQEEIIKNVENNIPTNKPTNEPQKEESDIPLVKALDIDAIKKEATELPKINANSDIARKLEEAKQEKMFNPEVVRVEEATNNSKGNFFNFLENEKVNMNTEELNLNIPKSETPEETKPAIESSSDKPQEETSTDNSVKDNQEEPKVDLEPQINLKQNQENDEMTPTTLNIPKNAEIKEVQTPNKPEVDLSSLIPTNPKPEPAKTAEPKDNLESKTDVKENQDNTPTPLATPKNEETKKETKEINLNSNFGQVLSESTPIKETIKKDFDPVDLIDTLDPNYVAKEEIKEQTDLKTAISTIRSIKSNLTTQGFNVSLEETDLNDTYQFIIKITKE